MMNLILKEMKTALKFMIVGQMIHITTQCVDQTSTVVAGLETLKLITDVSFPNIVIPKVFGMLMKYNIPAHHRSEEIHQSNSLMGIGQKINVL